MFLYRWCSSNQSSRDNSFLWSGEPQGGLLGIIVFVLSCIDGVAQGDLLTTIVLWGGVPQGSLLGIIVLWVCLCKWFIQLNCVIE